MRGNFLFDPHRLPAARRAARVDGGHPGLHADRELLYDCDAFLTSWLRDLAHEQTRNDGDVPLVVPAALPSFGGPARSPRGAMPPPCAERAPRPLRRPRRPRGPVPAHAVVGRYGAAQAGDSGLWAGRMQLGDWLDPSAPPDKPQQAKVDGDIVRDRLPRPLAAARRRRRGPSRVRNGCRFLWRGLPSAVAPRSSQST